MMITTELPDEFYDLPKDKQESFLAQRFIKLGEIENYYRELLGRVRGGQKIEKLT